MAENYKIPIEAILETLKFTSHIMKRYKVIDIESNLRWEYLLLPILRIKEK